MSPGDSSSDNSGPAIALYTLLPGLVQRRLSTKLRSLRRSLSQCEAPTRHTRPVSQSSIDSITPPPSYHFDAEETDPADEQPDIFQSLPSSEPPSRPSSSGSTTPTQTHEKGSGVHWRYADQGLYILKFAAQEASTHAPSSRLIRRQYVDGAACMLRGLPSDMSAEEEESIREALPIALSDLRNHGGDVLVRRHAGGMQRTGPTARARQSILHQWVAAATLYIFLVVGFVLPYLQLLLRQAYQLDRKHKISDRVLAQGMLIADAMGKRTLTLAASVCALNDGKVGDSMREAGVYLVQGFSGGVYDGLGDGMQALGLRGGSDLHDESASGSFAPSRR
ncbi:hypothetical protein DOTSEDRAFT_70436, partial [Dothistroma septosporum NZE10]